MAVSKRTRYEVLKRDNHSCRYCGATAPDAKLTVDHVTPVALGGSDSPDNLVAACRDCNYGKGSTNPDSATVEDVAQDAIRWSAAMKLAADRAASKQALVDDYTLAFLTAFERYYGSVFAEPSIYTPVLPDEWEASITTFYKRGLPAALMATAVDKTAAKARLGRYDWFRYFAGICWSTLREIQDDAERIVRAEGD